MRGIISLMTQDELHPCKCGCGSLTSSVWARGHHRRGADTRIPDPDAPDAAFDDDGQGIEDSFGADPPELGDSVGVDPLPEPGPDPKPAHAGKGWSSSRKGAKPKPGRVTAALRADIVAKIGFVLEMPARLWAMRDPICGGTFVQAVPDTAAALADFVCESPEMMEWFTAGAVSGFMKWFKLMMALGPVGQVAVAHHVYHSIELAPEDGGPPEDLNAYAA
jgi:hypothetical protein